MLSGVEVAGIVLALLPLCITTLEHYEDEIKPYKSLFKYNGELEESKKELFFVHASFTKTVQNLCNDADIADGEQFEEMVKEVVADVWLDNDSERKLEQFLSQQGYDAYRFKASKICDNIVEVANVLGLDDKKLLKEEGTQGFRSDLWTGIESAISKAQATLKPPNVAANVPPKTRLAYETFKKRIKFILKGGTIGPLVKKIAEDTQQLDRLIDKSSRPHASTRLSAKSRPGRSIFTRPLDEIEAYACKLHRALESVWSCSEHQSHCVHLRLERRLQKSKGNTDNKEDQAVFAIALASGQVWRSLNIHIVEAPPDRPNRVVTFQPPPAGPSQAVLPQLAVVKNLCESARTGTACLSFCLDQNSRLFGDYPVAAPVTTDFTACRSVTLKELLATSKRSEMYSAKQGMTLALTLVSSFLQLQSTPWLRDSWYAQDVTLLRSGTKLDVERPFVSQMYPPGNRNATPRPSDSERMFALGILLFEIITQTPIENRRTLANATREDESIMRSCLQSDGGDWLDCFAESIAACSRFYHARFDLDLRDPVTRREVVEAVLYPFQRDLNWF